MPCWKDGPQQVRWLQALLLEEDVGLVAQHVLGTARSLAAAPTARFELPAAAYLELTVDRGL